MSLEASIRLMAKPCVSNQQIASDLVSYDRWLEEISISPATGWRWRRDNRIATININGRVYIRRSAISEFERRAIAGEFAKVPKIPSRK